MLLPSYKRWRLLMAKKIALLGEIKYLEEWQQLLKNRLPDYEVCVWPEVGDETQVDILMTWKYPPGIIRRFCNIKLIISLGAGVDYLVGDADIAAAVPIVRLVAAGLSVQMAEYVTLAVLLFQRRFLDYLACKESRQWQYLPAPSADRFTVGMMGMGVLGSYVAEKLKLFSFPLRAWSRTPKEIEGIESFSGNDRLATFLSQCRVLVCLLPLTSETTGILQASLFSALPKGAFLINVARGQHLVEQDLIAALESGQIGGACLDVFQQEPLAPESLLWSHSQVIVTPHISAVTMPSEVIEQVVGAVHCLESGTALQNLVQLDRGY
jgi:glyoxylate/hydroxypyruvate reductase A